MQPVNANPFNDQVERVYFEIDEDKLDQWEKPQIKESKKAFFYATIRYCTVYYMVLHDILHQRRWGQGEDLSLIHI